MTNKRFPVALLVVLLFISRANSQKNVTSGKNFFLKIWKQQSFTFETDFPKIIHQKGCGELYNCFECVQNSNCEFCGETGICQETGSGECASIEKSCPLFTGKMILGSFIVLIGGIIASGVGLGGGAICNIPNFLAYISLII